MRKPALRPGNLKFRVPAINHQPSTINRPHSRASALLLALWSVLALSFAVAIVAERVALRMGDASIAARRLQARLIADSALATMDRFLKPEASHPFDPARMVGSWTSGETELGGGRCHIELVDEQSRANWLRTPAPVWRRILRMAGATTDQADAWQDALADWQDADDNRALNGAESPDYQTGKSNRRRARNMAIAHAGELAWIRGAPAILDLAVSDDGVLPLPLASLTTIHGDGRINLNTAPAILIAAALEIPPGEAEVVVRRRRGPDGEAGTVDDVPWVRLSLDWGAGASNRVTTVATLFRVRSVGEFEGQGVVREMLAKRGAGGTLSRIAAIRTVSEGAGATDWKPGNHP